MTGLGPLRVASPPFPPGSGPRGGLGAGGGDQLVWDLHPHLRILRRPGENREDRNPKIKGSLGVSFFVKTLGLFCWGETGSDPTKGSPTTVNCRLGSACG